LLLSISDQGTGIPESEHGRVFEKFYRLGNEETRKNKGTGLGLYLVKNIVRLHNGTIRIENNTPQGTKFILEFPSI
jgi:signal transduction histidine kinase